MVKPLGDFQKSRSAENQKGDLYVAFLLHPLSALASKATVQ